MMQTIDAPRTNTTEEPVSSVAEYDVVVLGTGEGAKYIAWTLAKQGNSVASIEPKYIGGSCPNIACMPSKNIIHSAKIASYFRRSEEFGISKDGFRIDMSKVRDRKRKMVTDMGDIHLKRFKTSGVELILGSAQFIAPQILSVELSEGRTRVLRGRKVIIGVGTHATIPNLPGLREAKPLTHIEALELDYTPEHLLVLGGGYVGLELAQAMRRFGSKVTVIDRNKRLAHKEDEDVSEALEQLCADEGIELMLNAGVAAVEGVSGRSVTIQAEQHGTKKT